PGILIENVKAEGKRTVSLLEFGGQVLEIGPSGNGFFWLAALFGNRCVVVQRSEDRREADIPHSITPGGLKAVKKAYGGSTAEEAFIRSGAFPVRFDTALRQKLERAGPQGEEIAERIHVIPGDVTAPEAEYA